MLQGERDGLLGQVVAWGPPAEGQLGKFPRGNSVGGVLAYPVRAVVNPDVREDTQGLGERPLGLAPGEHHLDTVAPPCPLGLPATRSLRVAW